MRSIVRSQLHLLLVASAVAGVHGSARAQEAPVTLQRGDRIVLIGNTFAERMAIFPHFEAELTARFAADSLTFRNLAWSADEVSLQPRPLNFGDLHTHLREQEADVIFAFFGMNESYAGREALPQFGADLGAFLQGLKSRSYNGESPPRVVLVSPIAHERLARIPLDPAEHNRDLALYSAAMKEVAAASGVGFIDLFTPTRAMVDDPALGDLTINGIHPNDQGYRLTSGLMLEALGAEARTAASARCAEQLLDAIHDKNELFFYRWRAVNGEYIYGRRREPFGVVNFPGEMKQLEEMIAEREKEIWNLAAGRCPGARAE